MFQLFCRSPFIALWAGIDPDLDQFRTRRGYKNFFCAQQHGRSWEIVAACLMKTRAAGHHQCLIRVGQRQTEMILSCVVQAKTWRYRLKPAVWGRIENLMVRLAAGWSTRPRSFFPGSARQTRDARSLVGDPSEQRVLKLLTGTTMDVVVVLDCDNHIALA